MPKRGTNHILPPLCFSVCSHVAEVCLTWKECQPQQGAGADTAAPQRCSLLPALVDAPLPEHPLQGQDFLVNS